MSNRIVVGIDYSMTCPAASMFSSSDQTFADVKMFYIHGTQRRCPVPNIHQVCYLVPDSQEERFDFLSSQFVSWIMAHTIGNEVVVYVEDYAFNARGKVFHIGENTGLLKHKLWKNGIECRVVPPTVVKKFATGRGNADKVAMYLAFMKKTGVDLKKEFKTKMAGVGSPFGDLADAYFIGLYGASQALDI